jgi:ATP-dependent Clp protease protease subunit
MIIPTVIDKVNNSERVYDIYSRLLKDRIIIINGEINNEVANSVVAQLLFLDSLNNEDINMYINSPGGSVTDGMAIYDTMNFINSDISTIGIGLCASMGAFLLSSGTKGKRFALPNSEVMIHQPLGGVQGQATEIKIAAERILRIRNKMNVMLSEMTNNDIKTIEKDTERDNFMTSDEALNYGIIDKIL